MDINDALPANHKDDTHPGKTSLSHVVKLCTNSMPVLPRGKGVEKQCNYSDIPLIIEVYF